MPNHSAVYLYCVVSSARRPAVARAPEGLAGATRPEAHEAGRGLWVIVAEAPLAEYGPGNLEPKLQDLDWVAATAVAHEAVVEHFSRLSTATVIPAKLFTLFSSLDKAIADVASRRASIARVMKRIAGSEEWGVRVTFGTRSPLALEASYIGSAQRIKSLGLDDNAYLVGNGVQGALRFNTTIDLPVQPFLFAGGAWRRYDLANTATNLSDVDDVDNVFELPLGVGVAGRASGLMIDVRGEFRPAFDEDLVPDVDGAATPTGAVPMHRWGVNANLGYEF